MEESNKAVKSRQPKKSQQGPGAPTSEHKNQQEEHQQGSSGKTSSKESIERIMASIPPPREDYVMAESDVMPDISPGQSSASGTNASDITGVVVPGHKEQEQIEEKDRKGYKGHHKNHHKDADSGHKKHEAKVATMDDHSEIQQKGLQDKDHEKELKVLQKKTIKAEKKVDKLKRKVNKAKRKDAKQSKQIKLHEKLTKAFFRLQRRKKRLDEADK